MIKELFINYWTFIKGFKKEASIAIASSIIGAFSEAYAIYILVEIINELKARSYADDISFVNSNLLINNESKLYLLSIFIIFAISASVLYFLSQKYVLRIKSLVEKLVRTKTTDALLKMEWVHFLKIKQGDIAKSIIAEGEQISTGCMYFISGITYFCISFTYLCLSLLLVRDSLIILILYGIFAYKIYQRFARRAERLGKDLSKITSSIGNSSGSIFGNLKYLRVGNLNKQVKKDSYRIYKDFGKAYERAMTSSYLTKGIMQILSSVFILIVLIYIIYTSSSSYSLLLSLALFIRMAPNIFNLQFRLLEATALVSWPKSYQERLKIAIKHQEVESEFKNTSIDIKGDIVFSSIEFAYPNSKNIISNLNLIIKENTMVTILGKSGSGKSTISDILTGLIKPSKGYITIGNQSLNSKNIISWRSRIGIVMQDNYLANESIAYNVALGEKEIDRNKVIDSLKKANAWGFIQNLPNGINECVMERGARFSGGQRQRIALARALYRDPKLLILDEPTSALDKASEGSIISSLNKLKGKLTILLITHKESLAKESDIIYFLEDGEISQRVNYNNIN